MSHDTEGGAAGRGARMRSLAPSIRAAFAATDGGAARRMAALEERGSGAAAWTFEALAGRLVELSSPGAGCALTMAAALVLDAQRRRETVAWVTPCGSSFYPPDVQACGVDLAALVVVRVPDAANPQDGGADGRNGIVRAATRGGPLSLPGVPLLTDDGRDPRGGTDFRAGRRRRGAVMGSGLTRRDAALLAAQRAAAAAERLLRSGAFGLVVADLGAGDVPMPLQARLAGLAEHHDAVILLLTEKPRTAPSMSSLVSLRAEAVRVRVVSPPIKDAGKAAAKGCEPSDVRGNGPAEAGTHGAASRKSTGGEAATATTTDSRREAPDEMATAPATDSRRRAPGVPASAGAVCTPLADTGSVVYPANAAAPPRPSTAAAVVGSPLADTGSAGDTANAASPPRPSTAAAVVGSPLADTGSAGDTANAASPPRPSTAAAVVGSPLAVTGSAGYPAYAPSPPRPSTAAAGFASPPLAVTGAREGLFLCTLQNLKDKRRPPGWRFEEVRRAPPGLR